MASRVSLGAVITHDKDTGFKSPTGTGSPSNQWALGTRLKTSDNLRSTSEVQGDKVDTDTYGFNIPEGAVILGIEVSVEGLAESEA